ncbi:hypothetical protein GA0115249_104117 [Streptomyces sp. PpalLS-921]|nr:hypothetical protein GA0115249_104117 [Streptomyces sp. PpalLS-921]
MSTELMRATRRYAATSATPPRVPVAADRRSQGSTRVTDSDHPAQVAAGVSEVVLFGVAEAAGSQLVPRPDAVRVGAGQRGQRCPAERDPVGADGDPGTEEAAAGGKGVHEDFVMLVAPGDEVAQQAQRPRPYRELDVGEHDLGLVFADGAAVLSDRLFVLPGRFAEQLCDVVVAHVRSHPPVHPDQPAALAERGPPPPPGQSRRGRFRRLARVRPGGGRRFVVGWCVGGGVWFGAGGGVRRCVVVCGAPPVAGPGRDGSPDPGRGGLSGPGRDGSWWSSPRRRRVIRRAPPPGPWTEFSRH